MKPPLTRPVRVVDDAKPRATASIEPLAPTAQGPRGHAARLHLELKSFEARFADRDAVIELARRALDALGGDGPATFLDVLGGKAGQIVGVEGSVVCSGRPDAAAIARLHETLSGAGYAVASRELRECGEASCTSTAVMDASRADAAPPGWFDAHVCGKHGYRACPGCGSLYVMTSANASGQAPSVSCEVCGGILIEWGGTKLWDVELVTRRERPSTT